MTREPSGRTLSTTLASACHRSSKSGAQVNGLMLPTRTGIASTVKPGSGAHAVVVCDKAGWHQTGRRLRVPDNITLLPLPSYAPELNPMENVWEYLRGNKLSRLVWDGYDAIVAACREAWHFLINVPDRIRSIGHRHWACVNV